MVKVLKKPGELSGWIELSDAIHHYLDPKDEPPPKDEEEAKKAAEEDAAQLKLATKLAEDMAGCAVRVRVLSELTWAEVDELHMEAYLTKKKARDAEKADDLDELELHKLKHAGAIKQMESNLEAIRKGLGEVRGFGFEDEAKVEVGEELIQALAASGYGWLIAQVVRSYQLVEPEERAGFFTPARATSPSVTAPTAAPTAESASTAA